MLGELTGIKGRDVDSDLGIDGRTYENAGNTTIAAVDS